MVDNDLFNTYTFSVLIFGAVEIIFYVNKGAAGAGRTGGREDGGATRHFDTFERQIRGRNVSGRSPQLRRSSRSIHCPCSGHRCDGYREKVALMK